MALYVSRPQVVEALQWTDDNYDELRAALPGKVSLEYDDSPRGLALILLAGKDGAQGWVLVPVGHWIVRLPGDLSDIWPVDNDYFVNKYVTKHEQEEDT